MATVEAQLRLSKQQRTSAHINEDLQKWTAARCNRLLRQISSRVSHLRQLVAEATDANRPPKRAAPIDDESPKRKRVRQTYGGRKTKPAPLSERDSNVSTPPRIMRVMGAMRPALVSSPAALCCPTPIRPLVQPKKTASTGMVSSDIRAALQQTRTKGCALALTKLILPCKHQSPEQLKTCQAILNWMIKLLEATEEKDHEPGRKSLLGMCMRKIPECINEIEKWDQQQAEAAGIDSIWGNSGAETTIYTQLEAFGGSEDGWKPFKLLARSHAMQILCKAVTEGLFASGFVTLLSKTCADMGCTAEAAQLLSACRRNLEYEISQDFRAEGDLSCDREACDQALVDLCTSEASTASLLPAMGDAIRDEGFSIADIAPKHRSTIWKTSLVCLSDISSSWLGSRLLIPTLESLASSDKKSPWASHEGKERTLTSLIAGLAAAFMSAPSEQDKRRFLNVFETAISQLLAKRGRSRRAEHSGLFLLMMARQVALETSRGTYTALRAQSLDDLDKLVTRSNVQVMYRQTAALCCSIAHACGRNEGKPSHEVLDSLRDTLQGMPLPQWFAQSLRSDGAFVLAHKTKDLRDLLFAESLPETTGLDSSQAPTMFSGWRWEASISEWVKPSPSGKATVKVVSQMTAPRANDRPGLERPAKVRMQRGLLLNNPRSRSGSSNIDKHIATNYTEGYPETLQSNALEIEQRAGTMRAAPRRRTMPVMRTYDGSLHPNSTHERDRVSPSTPEDETTKTVSGCGDYQGADTVEHRMRFGHAGKLRRTHSLALDAVKKPPRSSFVGSVENRACGSSRVRNKGMEEDGAQGSEFMQVAASTTVHEGRRQSTMAVPGALGRLEQRRQHSEVGRGQRRTTVSLSSLALWPGSDDWDELL